MQGNQLGDDYKSRGIKPGKGLVSTKIRKGWIKAMRGGQDLGYQANQRVTRSIMVVSRKLNDSRRFFFNQ